MGLEKTFYQVSEDVGVVEVCAIVYSPTIVCPIEFPFDVSLSTRDGSAGKHCALRLVHLQLCRVSEWNSIIIPSHTKNCMGFTHIYIRLYGRHNAH